MLRERVLKVWLACISGLVLNIIANLVGSSLDFGFVANLVFAAVALLLGVFVYLWRIQSLLIHFKLLGPNREDELELQMKLAEADDQAKSVELRGHIWTLEEALSIPVSQKLAPTLQEVFKRFTFLVKKYQLQERFNLLWMYDESIVHFSPVVTGNDELAERAIESFRVLENELEHF